MINIKALKEYLSRNKISIKEFSEMIGVDQSYVYRVFNNERRPGAKFIEGVFNSGISSDIFLTKPLPNGNSK